MDQRAAEDLRRIWRQNSTAVIVRKGRGERLQVKLPNPSTDPEALRRAKAFLQAARPDGRAPDWKKRFSGWELPYSWFNDLVEYFLRHLGATYIIQPYRPQEKCAPACMNAVGHECQCACMGENHGAGGPGAGWFVVSDTFATRWGEEELACRLLRRRKSSGA
jgi:hypothetical protein